jgi:hypothetical protein
MRGVSCRSAAGIVVLAMMALSSCIAQAPDAFRWIDFHSPKDQDVVVWVTRALDGQNWTAIREIGLQYDAALVITSQRKNMQSPANDDTLSVWSVSLTNRTLTTILKGVNLRSLDWLLLAPGGQRELGVLYEDCNNCASTTYFTALFYDLRSHTWAARWMRGGQGVPVWSQSAAPDVIRTQVYAVMADLNGGESLGTWNHFDYGKQKAGEDFLYRYDVDQITGLERMQLMTGKDSALLKERICSTEDSVAGLSRGQDSFLCQNEKKNVVERKPVTTPPPNNQGQSRPPGTRY